MSAQKDTKKPASAKSAPKKSAKAKPAEAPVAEPTATKTGRPHEPKPDGNLSALDTAAKVLGEAATPMTTGEMIAAMGEKGYWSSPGGKSRALHSIAPFFGRSPPRATSPAS